ncbi:hypothetical protein EDD16DRAFT_1540115 [Pisolithus croceorrhizus]|nr:hypothetical protein EDD16DRAFT_1540115 [Pisolithus croceorrhizus]
MQITDNAYSVSPIKRGVYDLYLLGCPRVCQIFYIPAANFVFPLILNIALIVFFTAVSTAGQHSALGDLLVSVNSYVTVLCVLCATVWPSKSEVVRTRNQPLSRDMSLLRPTLGRVYVDDRPCRNENIVIGRSATPDTVNLDSQLVTDFKRPATPTEEDKRCPV